jgi:hypothetical protein
MDDRIGSTNPESPEAETQHATSKHSLGGAFGAFATMGLVDVLAHLGPTGLVIGGIASYVTWKHGPEVWEHLGSQISLPTLPEKLTKHGEIGRASCRERV